MIDLSQSRITRSTKRGELAQTFINFPPMQKGASFNLDAVKAEMNKRMAEAEAASKGTGQ